MSSFFNNFSNFVGFLVLCIFIQMLLGKEILEKFLWIVLIGMILLNANGFTKFLKESNTKKKTQAEKKDLNDFDFSAGVRT